MRKRTLAALSLALLLFLPGGVLSARPSAEEKARQKAYEEARKAFAADFRSEDPAVRRAGVERLAPYMDLGAAELIVEDVLGVERHPGVLLTLAEMLGATTDGKVVTFLIKKATGKGDWQVRCTVAESLGYMKDLASKEAIRKLLAKEKDSRVLSMALFGVAERRMKESLDLVVPHLENEDWQVRVAAIEALGALQDEKGVLPLIDRLMNEKGRLREDIADALRKITGKDFGRDANLWRKWFHERDEMEDPRAQPAEPADPAGSAVKEPTYFGIKVVSDRVLFIIDVSMSMRTPIDIDKMKMAREAAMTGDDDDNEDRDNEKFETTIEWWKIKDRLDLAKAQLKFCIKNLTDKQKFEIVSFSETVESWNAGKLMKASGRAKAKAVQFIDTLDVVGATAAGAALDFAFEMAGPGSYDKNYKSGVDTVFFLSDGAPTDRPADEILAQLQARNRLRKIKIHVVAIVNYSVKFLRLLAKENGGIYKFFKVEDKR